MSGFAGIGKSTAAGVHQIRDREVLDLDSSSFSFGADGERNPNFVRDYVEAIVNKLSNRYILLVSSHPEMRQTLIQYSMLFYLIYPDRGCKEEYLRRFARRGTPQLIPIFEAL